MRALPLRRAVPAELALAVACGGGSAETETPRPAHDPCDVAIGDVSYPTFFPMGQLRNPIGSVRLANAGWA